MQHLSLGCNDERQHTTSASTGIKNRAYAAATAKHTSTETGASYLTPKSPKMHASLFVRSCARPAGKKILSQLGPWSTHFISSHVLLSLKLPCARTQPTYPILHIILLNPSLCSSSPKSPSYSLQAVLQLALLSFTLLFYHSNVILNPRLAQSSAFSSPHHNTGRTRCSLPFVSLTTTSLLHSISVLSAATMTSETDWSHDYCLYCEKQTLGGLYCSQACRLADLETPQSAPVSPSYTFGDSESLWGFASSTNEGNGFATKQSSQFQLPPPFNFEKYRASTSLMLESPPHSPRTAGLSSTNNHSMKLTRPAPPQRVTSAQPHSKTRSLNTSSSRSSLSSVTSSGSTAGLSEQALSQLQNYSNSFDHTRDWKRRVTLG